MRFWHGGAMPEAHLTVFLLFAKQGRARLELAATIHERAMCW